MPDAICSIEGCDTSPTVGRGWCRRHYQRWWKNGDPEFVATNVRHGPLPTPAIDRFQERYVEDERGCWIWQKRLDKDGYGAIVIDRMRFRAHRFAYEWFVGPVPVGLVLDHLCRVTSCVNPHHLEPVTSGENTRRGVNHHASRTHCPQGHPYEGANLIIDGTSRKCRTCVNERQKIYHARKVAERTSGLTSNQV